MGYTCFWTETFFKHPILLNYESCLHFSTIFTVSVERPRKHPVCCIKPIIGLVVVQPIL